jgi:hypothetical protein
MENRMQTELRKHQHTLIVYGTGTILFGLWSMAKSAVLLILDDSENSIANIIAESPSELGRGTTIAIVVAVVAIIYIVDLIFRWLVGNSARKIGMGKKKLSPGFIIAAMYIYLVDGLEFVSGVVEIIRGEFDSIDNLLTLLVDITSFVTVGEMVFAAIMVGKLTNEISQRGKAPAEVGK